MLLLTDTHFGIKNNSPIFRGFQADFFKETFFPYLEEHSIRHIYHLGDLFDSRRNIDIATYSFWNDNFLKQLEARKINCTFIIGNHDCYYKSTNSLNFLNTFLEKRANFNIISEPVQDDDILFMPWINPENSQKALNLLATSSASTVLGHLEVKGFSLFKGIKATHGIESNLLNNFKKVYSGHFHLRQKIGRISYIGAPYQMTWNDEDSVSGFYHDGNYINNPISIFNTVMLDSFEPKKGFIRLLVTEEHSKKSIEKAKEALFKHGAISVDIIKPELIKEITYNVEKHVDMKEVIVAYCEEMQYSETVKNILLKTHLKVIK
jgi:DNA repair exonuclease SbcCD nuclease subunit